MCWIIPPVCPWKVWPISRNLNPVYEDIRYAHLCRTPVFGACLGEVALHTAYDKHWQGTNSATTPPCPSATSAPSGQLMSSTNPPDHPLQRPIPRMVRGFPGSSVPKVISLWPRVTNDNTWGTATATRSSSRHTQTYITQTHIYDQQCSLRDVGNRHSAAIRHVWVVLAHIASPASVFTPGTRTIKVHVHILHPHCSQASVRYTLITADSGNFQAFPSLLSCVVYHHSPEHQVGSCWGEESWASYRRRAKSRYQSKCLLSPP